MGLPASELALFAVADLATLGVMAEAISDVAADVKAAQVEAAIDEVLAWIPNCKRPMISIGPYLQRTIGTVAVYFIIKSFRGVSGGDSSILKELRDDVKEARALIMASGNKDGIRLVFTDSTPDEDDFAPLGATHATADEWAQP